MTEEQVHSLGGEYYVGQAYTLHLKGEPFLLRLGVFGADKTLIEENIGMIVED